MAKMAVAMNGANLSSDHAVTGVSLLDHIFRLERPGEARPAGVAVKLVDRSKQRLARHDVHVNARLCVVPIGVIKRRLCCVTLRHLVLLGRKSRYGFRILVILRHMLTWIQRSTTSFPTASLASITRCASYPHVAFRVETRER